MVSQNLAFASCHVIILLGVVSFVTGEESLDTNVIDYGNPESSLNPVIKRNCHDYADFLLCQYLDYLQGSGKDQLSRPFGRDRDATITNNETEDLKEDSHVANLEKRFKVFRRQNFFSQGYKRGPGFRSWGGKRDPTYASQDFQKRSKFGAWGGKRDLESWEDPGTNSEDPETADKRTRFTSWGGKRSKFQSWGGRKRGEDGFQDGGKGDLDDDMVYEETQKRDINPHFRNLYLREPFKKHFPKRPQFQSWGGKRTPSSWNNPLPFYYHSYQPRGFDTGNEWMEPAKRKFSSWGGKRSDDDETTEDESSPENDNAFGNVIPPSAHLITGNLVTRVKRGNGNADIGTYVKLSSDLKSSKEGKQRRR